jgi:hypothetical protein
MKKKNKHIEFYKFVEFIIILFISFYIFTMQFSFIITIYMLLLLDCIMFDFKYFKKLVKAYKDLL